MKILDFFTDISDTILSDNILLDAYKSNFIHSMTDEQFFAGINLLPKSLKNAPFTRKNSTPFRTKLVNILINNIIVEKHKTTKLDNPIINNPQNNYPDQIKAYFEILKKLSVKRAILHTQLRTVSDQYTRAKILEEMINITESDHGIVWHHNAIQNWKKTGQITLQPENNDNENIDDFINWDYSDLEKRLKSLGRTIKLNTEKYDNLTDYEKNDIKGIKLDQKIKDNQILYDQMNSVFIQQKQNRIQNNQRI